MPFKNFRKVILPNGIRLVLETDHHVCSVSVGALIDAGSKYEPAADNGICHFIEHILFKGTPTRSARDIAVSIDQIGGQVDGGTSREFTFIETKALYNHLEYLLELMADMVFNPRLDEKDIENEKGVVLEEIKMYEDTHDEFIQDTMVNDLWHQTTLGQPILGTRGSVAGFTSARLRSFMAGHYTPDNIIVAACGRFDADKFIELANRYFGSRPLTISGHRGEIRPGLLGSGRRHIDRDLKQVHCCYGHPGVSRMHEDRYSLNIINTLLGSSMSSRLFQEVREKRGLVYSIYSYPVFCREDGLFIIYFATTRANYDEAIQTVRHEISQVKGGNIHPDELQKAKEHLKGNILLSFEGSKARMSILGRWELYYGRCFTVDELVAEIEKVTRDDIVRVANRILADDQSLLLTLGEPVTR